jgi:hypothetical protein
MTELYEQYFKTRSHWTVDGSTTIGLSVAVVSGEGGFIKLNDPDGNEVKLDFRIIGAGASLGLKFNYAVSGDATPSGGLVYMTSFFQGPELKLSDMQGMCFAVDAFAGAGAAVSAMAIFLGITPYKTLEPIVDVSLGPGLASVYHNLLRQRGNDPDFFFPKAVILVGGMTAGAVGGAGVDGYVGYTY